MLSASLFDYDLPDEFIARYPAARRDGSRMMVVDRLTGETRVEKFPAICDYLSPGDLLIFNDTRVLSGKFFARRDGRQDGAKFEILLLTPEGGDGACWNVMLKPGKRARIGTFAAFLEKSGAINGDGDGFTVERKLEDGTCVVRFSTVDLERLQRRYGHIPLPPYLGREDEESDTERYQTVYAVNPGAVAAPTAGLHFTTEILDRLRARGVYTAGLTLHVGPGTFKPVSCENVEEHKMHFEDYLLPESTAEIFNTVRRSGGRVLAVGTTSVRVLESCVDASGRLVPGRGRTDIFLYPPYRPRAVDMLLTNFHLPKSTLMMLVSCFCDREKVLAAYELAKREKFRFYSYGDCMLLK